MSICKDFRQIFKVSSLACRREYSEIFNGSQHACQWGLLICVATISLSELIDPMPSKAQTADDILGAAGVAICIAQGNDDSYCYELFGIENPNKPSYVRPAKKAEPNITMPKVRNCVRASHYLGDTVWCP